jgi:peroxiredoxin
LTEVSVDDVFEQCTQRCKDMDAPLSDRLARFAEEVGRMAPEFTRIVERMVARLKAAGAGEGAPKIGDEMPPFVLPDEGGRLVSLQSLLGEGSLVIAFHRGHWCPYCRINADALANLQPLVAAAGARMVAITPELARYNAVLRDDAGASFPILTDLDCGYALELQLAIKIDAEKKGAMIESGCDISPFQDNSNWILPIPATFVLDRHGVIVARFVDPDYRKRMELEELVSALQ